MALKSSIALLNARISVGHTTRSQHDPGVSGAWKEYMRSGGKPIKKRMMREVEMMRHTSEVLPISIHPYHTGVMKE
jgi:hypothetical protein